MVSLLKQIIIKNFIFADTGRDMELYGVIKGMASELGFADFGCAAAEELPSSVRERYMESLENGCFAGMTYLGRNLEKRFNPGLLVEGAASILVFLAPYSLPDSSPAPEGIAQYALGRDYHQVIKGKLFTMMGRLREMYPHFSGRAFTDSAPVLEREWAVRAGLGFVGKNNFLISKSCGIKNFIGVIICNLHVSPTKDAEPEKYQKAAGGCGDCTRCLQACPSGALERAFYMDSRRCISYHTIENRNLASDISRGAVPDFNGRIFGCDSCLDACPWNSRNLPGWGEFHENCPVLSGKGAGWWENLTQEEFGRIFKDSPLLRGGLENIRESVLWNKKNI